MDSLDFFRQLTRGARFTKRDAKGPVLPVPAKRLKREEELKEDPTDSIENEDDDDDVSEVEETASLGHHEKEPEQESENEPEFEFLGGVAPTKKKSKKKAPKMDRERQLEQEMINILRKEKRITVHGKNLPPPIISFEDLQTQYNVHEKLVKNLLACKYPEPTPIQMQAMPILLKGRPLLACAPTGSGKTVAFLAPIINDLRAPKKVGFRAIVLAPTRELAQQIYRECVRLSEKTALHIHIISKISQAKQKIGPESSQKCDILISTPNRIRYLLQQEPPILDLKSVEWFVLDEADRLMEEGQNNFKEQLDDILAACTNPHKKLALFSATYTVPVAKWALKNLKNLARVTVGHHNAATETVEQELRFVGSESGKLMEIRNLVHEGLKPPVLVFVQSKDRAKQLFEELILDGVNVDIIHADRTQQQRDNCVRAFREGHIWVLICTELMGRGIDFKGVNLVINFDFPPSIISYIHRIGRTGRAGRPGRAITFYTQNDMQYLRSIAQIIKNSGGKVPEHMLYMKKLRKSETKRLANYAVKREDISTEYKPISAKQEKYEKFLKKQDAKNNPEESSADVKRPSTNLKRIKHYKPNQQRPKLNGNKKRESTAGGRVTKEGKGKMKSKVK